ncbi:MAG: orotate phosphoribosyltransferase [Methanophagales archaeon]|nr:orotate phosphoribosyltransferase [Methanophagales archaeon]MCW3138266.1 orotate phosphoribosyltransferase [Methanophagales archaeon]MCW7069552.1 orotate phosphoribosyltransferase [Methanophagales archaeon]MCW7072990.1 orotate phosphoribosyltransferase [Methanophagales archaeon]
MPVKNYKEDFLMHLVKTGAIRFGSFKLKSGRISPYFVNIADAMRTGMDALKVADAYVVKIMELDTEFSYIHGAAYKGIPLAALVAVRLSERGIDKRWGYDRKEEKRHGDKGAIVGDLRDGDTVLIVDDVITTGATKVESWTKLATMRKVKPAGILVAVDREELSDADKKMLEEVSLRMYSILRITEIFEFLHNRTIEGEVYVDDKMKHNFEEYFQRYGTLC